MIPLDTDKTISGLAVLELYACPIGTDGNGNYIEHEEIVGTVLHANGECWTANWNRETGRTTFDAKENKHVNSWPYYLDLPQ